MAIISNVTNVLDDIDIPEIDNQEVFDIQDFNTRHTYIANHINNIRASERNFYYSETPSNVVNKVLIPFGNAPITPIENSTFFVHFEFASIVHQNRVAGFNFYPINPYPKSDGSVIFSNSWRHIGRGLYICHRYGNKIYGRPLSDEIQFLFGYDVDGNDPINGATTWLTVTNFNKCYVKNAGYNDYKRVWTNGRQTTGGSNWTEGITYDTSTHQRLTYDVPLSSNTIPQGYYYGLSTSSGFGTAHKYYLRKNNPCFLHKSLSITSNGQTYTFNNSENITVPEENLATQSSNGLLSSADKTVIDNLYSPSNTSKNGHTHNFQEFTYIVDSDQKLADWANNVAGNDYTSVLIRKGVYTLTYNFNNFQSDAVALNLQDRGTKVVVGEPGNKVWFISHKDGGGTFITTFIKGWDNGNKDNSIYIRDLNIEVSHDLWNSGGNTWNYMVYVFNNCKNLYNCQVTTKYYRSLAYMKWYTPYYKCNNLYNCYAINNSENGNASYFKDCYQVHNCKLINNFSGTLSYSNSYASDTAIADYACANTPAGGWNS